MNKALSWVLVGAAIGGGYYFLANTPPTPIVIPAVVMPALTPLAAMGEPVFQGTCAACHGADLAGTDNGPPLVVATYRTAMHADFAIASAIKNGVTAHHWRFGSMPPQADIAEEDIPQITAYIREVQAANGIN